MHSFSIFRGQLKVPHPPYMSTVLPFSDNNLTNRSLFSGFLQLLTNQAVDLELNENNVALEFFKYVFHFTITP